MSIPTHATHAEALRDVGASPGRDGLWGGAIPGVSVFRIESVHPDRYDRPPHRVGYFAVVLLEGGRGRFSLDGVEQDARPGLVYLARPGHVKAYAYTHAPSGWIVTFTEAFLKTHADVHASVPFLVAEPLLAAYPGAEAFDALGALAAAVAAETRRPSTVQAPLIAAYLVALLLRLREALWDGREAGSGDADRAAAITRSFRTDLEARLRALVAGEDTAAPTVAALAEAQGIHPDHLSAVVKRATGRTAGDWAAEALAVEARALLSDPDGSVKEAAYRLGFSEPAAFSRFFKRETGLSPTAFRRGRRSSGTG